MSDSVTELARRVTLVGYVLLLVVLSLQVFGITTVEPATRGFLWVIWAGPLVVFLPGLLRGTWKSYIWLCFVLLVYFMGTVSGLAAPPNAACEWLQLVLVCLVFTSAMLYARWRQRELAGHGA
ncbi:MAG TPA: DUF2069 domain-containing protein [Pseudomonadales bacterium]|nr:DUF2069 domain-containing protein [Pseudomonadales bacterium]HNC68987.1 DUF2069 domain-containing protein [Pseudomonadales bacterium]